MTQKGAGGAELNVGKVNWLVVSQCQSKKKKYLYRACDLNFAEAFNKADVRSASWLRNLDETGQISHWHIPAAHFLESWSDARA